ncbi:SdrD B-like domain-containing protein [Runella sp. MFBS21]|uniref:SdrD B-like domain-containing protein n=1 Tax=Runella sp. MFBS21 TaxID=3034018 RepID=UPI0023FA4773|nr:SdrD B-like domain-containing protein [Runella sp. MFBS21]MDF7820290.1 SdrD B-like domain-containing protein [Runella sp. MFBS21]
MKIVIQQQPYNKLFFKRHWTLLFIYLLFSFCTYGQISGNVFIDFNGNGLKTNTSPFEPGIGGIKVKIFVGTKSNIFETHTDSSGNFSFSSSQIPPDSVARVEFSDLPKTFYESFVGSQNYSGVQFVKAPAVGVNLGIINNDELCTSAEELKIVTACYAMGDPLKDGDAAQDPALILVDYQAKGEAGTPTGSPMEKLAKANQIGSTWIAAYQRATNLLLVGAITRRHVGLGPLGTGGYYSIDLTTGAVNNFLDVKKIGIDTGPDPHLDPITQVNILPASKTARSRDSLAFQMAGKIGIGGSQLSPWQDTLFLVNLYDQKLYSFAIQTPLKAPSSAAEANVKSYNIPHPNCSNGEFVPWALKYYRGDLYVGVVCTGATSQKKSDLKAAVYKFDLTTKQFSNIFEFGLDYPRGPIDNTQGCDTITTWNPWTNQFPKQCNYPLGAPDPIAAFAVYPQPILSDLEFDDDGSLLLSFLDRLGLQTGQNQPGIAPDDTLNYYGFMSGDLVRAQRNANGTFTLENNAQSGDLLGCGSNTNSGPGGGEFFCEDYWLNGSGGVGHAEITNGGLLKMPGNQEILVSSMDPIHGLYLSTGFIAFDTKTGKRNRSFSVYSLSPGSLGKSGGVGDLTALCQNPPLEIGNLLWLDTNRNGIQDPNESLLDGLVITLHDMEANGAEIARDTTSNGGQYYFNDANVTGGVKANHAYEVRLSLTQSIDLPESSNSLLAKQVTTSTPIQDILTVAPKQVASGAESLVRDSDAAISADGSYAFIPVLTSANYRTNHYADLGLMLKETPAYDLAIVQRVVGDKCTYQKGEEIKFEIVIRNTATDPEAIADSVRIKVNLNSIFTLMGYDATASTYNATTHLWGNLKLNAGKSDTLILTVQIPENSTFEGGLVCNIVEVENAAGTDIDSSPNNNITTEDDFSLECISVPVNICVANSQKTILKAPEGSSSYQWYKNDTIIQTATNQTLEVNSAGNYTVKIAGGICPTQNCCPIVVQDHCECIERCVKFEAKKIKE